MATPQRPNNAVTQRPPAAVAPASNLGELQRLLETHKAQIEMAIPRHMTPERMIRVAMTAVSSTWGLAECAPVTIAACVVQASILGLEPSSVLGEAYLVPFWNGKTKRKECQLIPGYMGLVKLARNSGEVSMIDAQIVYDGDDFDFEKGSDTWWRHKWAKSGARGKKIGVWAGYVLKDGSKNFEYWTLEQIHEHRDKFSKGAYDKEGNLTGAWKDSPDWMEKKTVIRQVIKLMPKSVELATALSLEERADAGVGQIFDVTVPPALTGDPGPEVPELTPPPSNNLTPEQAKRLMQAWAGKGDKGVELLTQALGNMGYENLGQVQQKDLEELLRLAVE
jgi:recombination protein RecT